MEEPSGTAVGRLRVLTCPAGPHILCYLRILPNPEGKATYQRPRLGPPKVAAERAIVALAKDLCAQAATLRDAQAICLALAPTVEEATTHQERATFRRA